MKENAEKKSAQASSEEGPRGYHALFERLTDLMTSLDGFDVPGIFDVLAEMCRILGISKGVTTFYQDAERERAGDGEVFVCYDSGEKHKKVSSIRAVTPAKTVAVCDAYQAEGAPPLSPRDLARVESVERLVLSFMNRSRQEQVIHRLTYYDANGFENLRLWFAQLGRLIAAGRIANKAAIRFNLKHFSMINEQVGRETADRVMQEFCRLLRDAVGPEGMLGRLGGDNFVVLCPTERLPQAEAILNGVTVVYDPQNELRISVAAVAGIYETGDGREIHTPGDVMDRISSAYSAARRSSVSDILRYNEAMRQAREQVARVQRLFDRALKNGEFLVYFQPKVDIQTRELIGAEALCRWQRKGKLIPPAEFIPALERGMDICRLDFYMLEQTCRHIRRWLDEGRQAVRVSVNLSRRHLIDPNLFDHIVSIVDQNRVPHEYIEIELTETTSDVSFRDLKRIVGALQQAGIQATVDDFGVGYSSLNLIKEIPWDVLKLDKSILPQEGEDEERGSRMFAHVVAMAHEIGLKCVAEGVETEEQLALMRHYGCRLAQGFLFDRPLPVEEFEKRLDAHTYRYNA